ncbi:MAG: gamma-glutamylcyclotransferase family protein [Candidatus Paceibacteria bacterium]
MLSIKYFAYGSNLDIERLRNRIATFSDPIKEGIPYTLQNYRLVFNAGYMYSGIVFANIVLSKGEFVEGILYDITPAQLKELDRFEALYEKHFFYLNNNTIACVYIAENNRSLVIEGKPSLEYLNIIIDSCKKLGFTRTYDNLVEFKLSNYKIRKSKHKKSENGNKNIQRGVLDTQFHNDFV